MPRRLHQPKLIVIFSTFSSPVYLRCIWCLQSWRRRKGEGYRVCKRITIISWGTNRRENVFRRRKDRLSGFSSWLDPSLDWSNGTSWRDETTRRREIPFPPWVVSKLHQDSTDQRSLAPKRIVGWLLHCQCQLHAFLSFAEAVNWWNSFRSPRDLINKWIRSRVVHFLYLKFRFSLGLW